MAEAGGADRLTSERTVVFVILLTETDHRPF